MINRRQVLALGRSPSAAGEQFARHVEQGLAASPRHIPSLYFYDEAGWQIWQRIKELPEYYPTRTETAIIREYSELMAAHIPPGPVEVIELGAGFSDKTFEFLNALADREVRYRPIDVSPEAILNMGAEFERRFPHFSYDGIVATYETGLQALRQEPPADHTRVILFLGSNIGNMTSRDADQLLQNIRLSMRTSDRLIVGFDRFKAVDIMQAAYDDPTGVTAEFNLNLLRRMNRELGGNIDVNAFRHHAYYDPHLKAMVSWLIAAERQTFRLAKISTTLDFTIEKGEGIWTEMSRKYTDDDIVEIGRRSNIAVRESFSDPDNLFSVVMFEQR